jgi:cell division septation protein DedD
MQRIFALDEPPARAALIESEPEPEAGREIGEDFELVVGRRQVAAFTFLALVVVAVSSGGSYLAGKAMSAREDAAQPVIQLDPQAPSPMPAPMPALMPAPMIEATIVPPPSAPVRSAQPATQVPAAEAPLFASPVPKAIYIQVGAVEKGVATVIAEGLRKHALDSFVTPVPSGKMFRVLIGPFPDAEAYQKARAIVDQIGLSSFARRYQSQ